MATYLGKTAVFEVRSGATAGNLGGGGFNPANANFISDWTATSANTASPVISSATYNFVAGDVNAYVYVKSGTNWTPGWYQIASVNTGASPATATLKADIGQAINISNNLYVTNTVAGCATTASPTSGNCGIDYSQQNAAQFTATTLTGATTTFTDATHAVGPNWVGNFVCMASGTGVTAGWYEVVSQSSGTATIDRTAGTTFSSVTYYLGGAVSLGGTTTGITDVIFVALGSNAATSGNRFFVSGNATYTLQASVTTLIGNAAWPVIWEGYNLIRGDRPSIASGTQPNIIQGTVSNTIVFGDYSEVHNISSIGSNTSFSGMMKAGSSVGYTTFVSCKAVNKTTTSGRYGFLQLNNGVYIGCEGVCYNGTGLFLGFPGTAIGCYAHDSSTGISAQTSNGIIINCIIAACSSKGIDLQGVIGCFLYNNTVYGGENKTGTGINYPSGGVMLNNILYGFVSGYGGSDTGYGGVSDYTCFYNNTNNIAAATTGTFIGSNDLTAINPTFTDVAQVTGTTATSSGTTLTDGSKNFTTSSVVAGRDYLYVISGTGATVGIYGITVVGTTTLTTDNTIGTSNAGNLTYQITTGRNFLPTGAV